MRPLVTWRRLAVIGSVCLLSACAQTPVPMAAANPPTQPGPRQHSCRRKPGRG